MIRSLAAPVALLIGLAAPAFAEEDAAALLARAPAVTLDGPVTPLAAPVEVTQAGWGPFRRLCVAQMTLRPADGEEVAAAPPSCFTFEQARVEGGTWHLSLRAELGGRGPDIPIAVTRDERGRFGPVAIGLPAGAPPIPPQQMERLRTVMQAALQAHGMERTTIVPGTAFLIPLPIGGVNAGMQVQGGGFTCDPEGEGRLDGRRVVLGACRTSMSAEISPGRAMRISAAGRFAIDVETGMILRHGYGSFLVMEADPGGSMARAEMRGASRQSLE